MTPKITPTATAIFTIESLESFGLGSEAAGKASFVGLEFALVNAIPAVGEGVSVVK